LRIPSFCRTVDGDVKKPQLEFALLRDESVVAGIRRTADEELEHAIEQLRESLEDESRDQSLHEARKTIKRLRGLIRLVPGELGEDGYRVENDCLRSAAKVLAAAREAAAAGEAFDALLVRFEYRQPQHEFSVARARITERYEHTIAVTLDREAIQAAIGCLEQVRGRVRGWPLARDEWEAIADGLTSVYAQGSDEFELAQRKPTVENLHEWRKRVKYHWYHIRFLRLCWLGPLSALRDELKLLGDLLGDDHDLAELAVMLLREAGDPPMIDAELAKLLGLVDRRRRELIAQAFSLGARIYAERPRRLVARLGSYYAAWRSR